MNMKNNKLNVILENAALRLEFSREAGGLVAITSKLTGETYAVTHDVFAVETTAFRKKQPDLRQVEWATTAEAVRARYADADLTVDITYELRPADHFFQKRMAVTFAANAGVKQITLSRPVFTLGGLAVVCYRHPDFDWISDLFQAKHGSELRRPADSEPSRTFFGRTAKGGFFTGIEMPYDNSRLEGKELNLGYAPSLKVKAGESLACEPMYLGVYRRSERDARAMEWAPIPAAALSGSGGGAGGAGGFDGAAAAGLSTAPAPSVTAQAAVPQKTLPLPSESAAMAAMAATILGPPRHGLMAFACGWHCQMEQGNYDSDEKLEGDLRSAEFVVSCGLDGVSDPHPWGGESRKMADLRDGDHYAPGPRERRFLDHARKLGLKVTQWPTMNTTHPWKAYSVPFRQDRPDWLRGIEGEARGGSSGCEEFQQRQANCVACSPFAHWLERVIVDDALGSGLYDSWGMDGDFWGTGAYFNTTLPVTCLAENHDHLPGDSNYACQRMLQRLIDEVRRRYPGIYIVMCRPPMDLGVWAQRNVDACFTLIESGTGISNVAAGDEVRTASRIRVHHHFFPHWLDQALLFPSYAGHVPAWPSTKIDYLILSALSCSPNLLMYLPTKTGIPEADKVEIRKWLDWGRANVKYLLVRQDLFDWPGKGKVDGSAHFIGDCGLIFLFNGTKEEKTAEFALTAESTGFMGAAPVEIRQDYPAAVRRETYRPGATVTWTVPAETAVVLRITPL